MQTNSNISYTGLVEKYVGTAYDQMAAISANLQELLLISASIADGSFAEVATIADEIQGLIDKIDEFNNTYYGALDAPPALDPTGQPITDGDLYFDTEKELMYVFYRDTWAPLGAVQSTVEHRIVGDNDIAGNIIRLNNLEYPYLVGTHNMTVHRNGDLLINRKVNSTYGEYTEIDDRTIEMYLPTSSDPERLLLGTTATDRITIHIGTEAATVTHVGRVGQYTYKTVHANEQVITIPNNANYIVGSHNLTVHLKSNTAGDIREFQLINEDYTETNPTQITFADPLKQDAEVTFTIGHITASDDAHTKVLMQINTPGVDIYEEGQLWFKEDTGRMYILYLDDVPDGGQVRQWVSTAPEDLVINPGYEPPATELPAVIHGTIFQNVAPDPTVHSEGTLWFNTATTNLHIKYFDGDTHQWVKVSA